MKILLLEDRGSAAYPMKDMLEELRSEPHEVFLSWSVREARAQFQGGKAGFDCIIADLNVPADGLSPSEFEESQGGQIAGWIWLESEKIVRKKNDAEPNIPKNNPAVIVCSGYLNVWRQCRREGDYPDVAFIAKAAGGAARVMERVNAIAARGEGCK